ncbi:hypothetical protein OIU77_029369 [Salix suchowensis]|uniref:Homoserine kinase n=1 Tax=Salix suchowensis TaxID=1278906 RepID=A0ABQ9BL00_9ROSI|nr:hypothetical protein OIU78_009028 [Salix suchowensis]KAJ6386390.1 hypothetical protein OIU77_029369 [Salix suchowensis]
MLNIRFVSLSLSLEKGLPLGSGLGSSAASAVAAAVAVNELCGRKLEVKDLVLAGLESEAKVSGYHADTIAPAIMGDFSSQGFGGFSVARGCGWTGEGIVRWVIKLWSLKRAALIPGMEGVKKAALEAGAFGCTISGAGPTAVAVVESEERGVEIGVRMVEAFWKEAI